MTNRRRSKQPIQREFLFVTEAAERDFKDLPEDAQKDFGHAFHELQLGEDPWDAKALKGFPGASVMELLTDNQDGTYRAMYTVKRFKEAEADHKRRTQQAKGGKP